MIQQWYDSESLPHHSLNPNPFPTPNSVPGDEESAEQEEKSDGCRDDGVSNDEIWHDASTERNVRIAEAKGEEAHEHKKEEGVHTRVEPHHKIRNWQIEVEEERKWGGRETDNEVFTGFPYWTGEGITRENIFKFRHQIAAS